MEHLEVMPISSRVVCLNAPYLKSLSVFEALSRTLGCYYNHHRPQVVSCHATVRLPAPRIVKVRGHASHAHTPCETPTVQTTLQIGTYLVFYLKDWSDIHKCQLIINGIEKVSKAKAPVPPKIYIERVFDSSTSSNTTPDQDKILGNGSFNTQEKSNKLHNTNSMNVENDTVYSYTQDKSRVRETHSDDSDEILNENTQPNHVYELQSIPVKERIANFTNMHQKNSKYKISQSNDNCPSKIGEKDRIKDEKQEKKEKPKTKILTINMDQSEEITTLLDDDDDDDSEYTSDTSDDLHKVIRKRLSVDVTSLIHSCPKNNILVLLMKPAEETQAWQFLSSCMKVTHLSPKTLDGDGTGTIKKTLTRTRPIYFCKNGNAQRL